MTFTRSASLKAPGRLCASIVAAVAVAGTAIAPAFAATIEKIERRGILEVCVNPDAMPYSTAFDGEKGLHIDMANAFAKELGVSTRFSWVQFRYQAKYTRCDAYMGVGIFKGEEDDGPVKKTQAIFDYETVLVSRPDTKLDTLDALNGQKIGVQSGSLAHVTLLDRPVDTRVSFIRENEMLDAIRDGRLDGGFVSNVSLAWYRKNHPDAKLAEWPASIAQKPTGYPIGVGLRRVDAATVKRFNEIIDKLRASGELAKIFGNYGMEKLVQKQ